MKKFLLAICIIASFGTSYAQDKASSFTDRNSDQPRDPRVDQMSFVPNEVLVKFKDEVPLSSATRLRSAGLSAVDKVLQANGIDSLVRLFPNTKNSLLRSTSVARIVKDPQGRDMKIPNLDKIFKITLPQLRSTSNVPVNIFQVVEDLKTLPEVEYAEPNYIYSVDDLQPVGPVLTADDVKKMQSGLRSSLAAVVPNDPLYAQQWYIPAVKADLVWEQTTGDTTQVIAILDTGVDWNHPDLKNKIWTNKDEIPGNGIDDDGNGLIDDIRGWDYINNDNNPMDDNSHGTHVAGIAAAETNNGIGIAGVNWNAKIMPIKVFQSSGRGDAATIAMGINYAALQGVTVINMSFGSYVRSLTMEDALVNAYISSVLVAAAGNDGLDINGLKLPEHILSIMYPAALSFVLGVASPNAEFSNKDEDGPIFSKFPEGWNYELKAPGTSILSTIPNGNYRIFQGTSMATPIVASSVCLYKTMHSSNSVEKLFGDFIYSISDTYIDVFKALNPIAEPKLSILTYEISDTLNGDKDGRVDNNEVIQFRVKIQNSWLQTDSVKVGIELGEFEDKNKIEILTGEALVGSISEYAKLTNEIPLTIKINPTLKHNTDIVLNLKTWYGDMKGVVNQVITLNVENGEELSGVIDSTLILTPDKLWLVSNSFKIASSGHLIIKPGTEVLIYDNKYIYVQGKVSAIGTKDSLISINANVAFVFDGNINNRSIFKYCHFDNTKTPFNEVMANLNGYVDVDNCLFFDCGSSSAIHDFTNNYYLFTGNNFFGDLYPGILMFGNNGIVKRNQFVGLGNNQPQGTFREDGISGIFEFPGTISEFKYNTCVNSFPTNVRNSNESFYYNSFIKPENSLYNASTTPGSIVRIPYQYWGTSVKEKIKMYDFYTREPRWALLDYSNFLTSPSDSCHAQVWKILVNGKDAQDEYVEPVGVGKQRFDVFFNRSMDKTIKPQISFGVREPYNQHFVSEDGSWSEDGNSYTAYKTIKLTTGDGINRLRVAGAKESDGWAWEIPIEDTRFSFILSAASSSSLEFVAAPGLGKVSLEWNNNDLADGLGYNMYRMEHINDSTLTAPVIINTSLISDTLYTDYSVTPNKKYYYFYKIVRTDLSETDSSKVVSAVPFTASKGDANGDLSVNVLDITIIVAYLLNNNPQPFITEAADMNSDGNINVLDIVGVVNKVLYGGLRSVTIVEDQQASLYMQNDTLFADASTAIGGLQFDMNGISSINDIQVLDALQVFESGYSQRDSTTLRLLYYSMSGKSIAAGNRIPLLKIKKSCILLNAIVSDKGGASIPVSLSDPTIGNRNGQGMTVAELGQNYPNPSKGQTTLPVQIFEKVDEAAISIYNMLGQQVKVIKLDNPSVGKHEILWSAPENKGLFIYKLEIRIGGQQYVSPLKKMIVL